MLRRDPGPLVRADAVEYAAAAGDAAILPELQAQLGQERDERVRQAIEWSIRLLRNETTEPPPRIDALQADDALDPFRVRRARVAPNARKQKGTGPERPVPFASSLLTLSRRGALLPR